uniref:Uncharacterized protein n=1 Tax=Inoviridae sp. ctS4A1 TaxID=2825781 RepID=A0A8S5RU29_9VIRU|nr:MAG TPA: hypothetical protein [Inoviridae sp. ctS4A1]
MDPILEQKIDLIVQALSQANSTYHLQTSDQLYTIHDNVIVPDWIVVSESGTNLVLSYSDNQLSEAPILWSGDIQQIRDVWVDYINVLLLMFAVVLVFYKVFRLFKRFV